MLETVDGIWYVFFIFMYYVPDRFVAYRKTFTKTSENSSLPPSLSVMSGKQPTKLPPQSPRKLTKPT
jgi:hypothetical protein